MTDNFLNDVSFLCFLLLLYPFDRIESRRVSVLSGIEFDEAWLDDDSDFFSWNCNFLSNMSQFKVGDKSPEQLIKNCMAS